MLNSSLEVDAKIIAKYLRYFISLDPLIGDIPITKQLHSGGAIYKSAEKKLQIPLEKMSFEILISKEDIRNYNLEKICNDIYEYAERMLNEMKKNLFATVSQVSEFTGNVVDGMGKGVSHEMLLEMLEKIHIDFDQDGNPQFPSLVVHPDMVKNIEKLKADEALYKARYDEIIAKKKEAYYAEKGSRRLSRVD